MKLEAFHNNNNNKKKKFIIGFTIICIALVVGVFLYHSYAWFTDENTFNSFSGDVTPVGDLYFSVYVDDEASTTVPSSSSGYAFNHGTCTNGASVTWDSTNWAPTVTNLSSTRTKCMLYFNLTAQATLNKLNITPSPAASCPTMDPTTKELQISASEDTQSLLCEAEDDYGTTYYYRGNVTNNYVKFGKWQTDYYYGYANYSTNGIYTSLTDCETAVGSGNCTQIASSGDDMHWRIVRINGDGSIRLVYDGTSAYANINSGGSTSNGIQRTIGATAFNYSVDNSFNGVAYMYNNVSYEIRNYATLFNVMNNKNATSSSAKVILDNWYANNILSNIQGTSKKYSDYLSLDSIFCNDKNNYGDTELSGQFAYTHYDATQGNLLFTCVNNNGSVDHKNDAFTVSSKGNGALTYPVGLLTIDEVTAAGEWNTTSSPYIRTGYKNLTMTPLGFDNYVGTGGDIWAFEYAFMGNGDNNIGGIRPVISLKANVTFASGTDGTINNPYEIVYN